MLIEWELAKSTYSKEYLSYMLIYNIFQIHDFSKQCLV